MQVGCCAYTYRHYLDSGEMTLEDFIREVYAAGLDGIDLTEYFFSSTDAAYLYRLKRLALDHGLDISGAAIGGAFALPDGPRAAHVAFAKEWVDVAVMLGAPCLRVFAGPVPEGHSQEEAVAWCIDGLKEVLPYAEQKGVVLGLENHGGITSTYEQVARILKGVGSDWLRVTLDVGNYRTDPYREIAQTVPHTVTVHAKNQIGTDPPQRIDYPRVIHLLREGGFKGYLSIEVHVGAEAKSHVVRFGQYLKTLTAW